MFFLYIVCLSFSPLLVVCISSLLIGWHLVRMYMIYGSVLMPISGS